MATGTRFEASAFDPEARAAIASVKAYPGGFQYLYGGDDSPIKYATNAFRFRRVFVKPDYGVRFISSSDIINIDARTDKYLSRKNTKKLNQLLIEKGDVLISCSGTVGNIGFAGRAFEEAACSQHVIRARSDEILGGAFVAAFLKTKFGQLQLTRSMYGSVVQHIEPEHLTSVVVPKFHQIERAEIGRLVLEAVDNRDTALDLLREARLQLLRATGLEDWSAGTSNDQVTSVRLSKLNNRFEASFHSSRATDLDAILRSANLPVQSLESFEGAKVGAVTKFRKRIYVDAPGIPLLTSKQILQIDPIDNKMLGRGRHLKDLPEIALKKNMLLVTCSGTIGRELMVPEYMEGWAASQDALRIITDDPSDAAYLYAWLSSEPGQVLVRRLTYGSVVVHIDKDMLAGVAIPVASREARRMIAEKVLLANDLRDQAWRLEHRAIDSIEAKLASPSRGVNPT
jgi:type I restriction enzyme S subunit